MKPSEKTVSPAEGGRVRGKSVPEIIGLACLWPLLQASTYFPFNLISESGQVGLAGLSPWHEFYSAALIVAGIVCVLVASPLYSRLDTRPAIIACGVCGFIGEGILALLPSVADAGGWVLIASVLVALAVVGLIGLWGVRSSCADARRAVMVVALSYAACEGVLTVCSFVGADIRAVLVLCPLASAACLLAPYRPASEDSIGPSALKRLPWRMLVPGALFVYFGVIFVRVLIGYSFGGLNDFDRAVATCMPFIVFAIVALYVSHHPSTAEDLTVTFAVLVVVYMAALTAVLVFADANYTVVKRVLVASEHCFEVFIWMTIAAAVGGMRKNPFALFAGYAVIIIALPSFVSFDVMQMSGVLAIVSDTSFSIPLAAVASFATASISILYLAVTSLHRSEDVRNAESDWRIEACRTALGGCDLSERELEVASCLYRGLSAKKIAEELYVSESTVKTHTGHIYTKLGIHSKQEFIALIDAERSKGNIS